MDELAWILGSSRTGSTWLMQMLAELDGVHPIDDPHLGHHLGVWRPSPLAWGISPDREELEPHTLREERRHKQDYFFSDETRWAWEPPLRQMVEARFRAQVPHGVALVKEPASQEAALLLELFPESRAIWLVRDGRDCVDSWLAAHAPGAWFHSTGGFRVGTDRLDFLRWQSRVWAARMDAVSRAWTKGIAHGVIVRYEQLLAEPVTHLARCANAIGKRPPTADLQRIVSEHRFHDPEPGGFARAATPGSWKQTLTYEEVVAVEDAMGPTLERLGYSRSTPEGGT